MLFDHYANVFISIKKTEVKPSTLSKYQNIIDTKILITFGSREIDTIKPSDCRIWFASHSDKSPKTLRDYASVLSGIFEEARFDEAIEKNPANLLRIPKLQKRSVKPFTQDEVQKIIDSTPEGNFKYYLYIAFYTGMRSGEIIALKKIDIDFENRVISVSRSRGRFGETSPKTQNGIRLVPILDILLPHLQKLYVLHLHDYLFINRFGVPYRHNETFYQKHWVPLLKRLNIPYRRLYNSRHTFATMMLTNGLTKPHKLAEILGHGDSQMVYQVYARYIEDKKFDFDMDIDPYGV